MERRLALLLFSGFIIECTCVPHHFHFVNMNKTWTEAQSYCREKYTDLATIENMEDMEMMMASANGYEGMAWIGLYETTNPSWKWSLVEEDFYGLGKAMFTAWNPGEPNGGSSYAVLCAQMIDNGLWIDIVCDDLKPFICYDGTRSGHETYVLINEKKSWREAQRYCREKHTDLVSVRNETENHRIREKLGGDTWIGLFRDKWMWSDNRTSSFRHWRPGVPDNNGTDNFAVTWLTQEDKGKWGDRKCDEQYPFLCRTDKVQLIMKNLSWAEALHYCRDHHMDLVSVFTEEIQGWVMEVAKKASTEHVWLGLHFLCPLDMWHWTNRQYACYANWAERGWTGREACAVDGDERAGAVQSGGNQQWVSLHESTRLNFICATG